jgi:hypothetical protein
MPALTVAALALAGCEPGTPAVADAGIDAAEAEAGQGAPPTGDLIVNEIAPRPLSGPDWIELHNRSSEPVDLCDYFLSDSLDRLDHYHPLGGAAPPDPCEPQPFAPGGYLVVGAGVELPFGLGVADEIHVIGIDGAAVDSLVYLFRQPDGTSLARRPDADGLFFAAEPSPGEANP